MPSKTAKQSKFMKAVANNPKFAKKVGVPQSVGKDFEMADKKMKKFNSGGASKKPSMPKDPASGGAGTVPMTPERKKFLEEMEKRNKAARDAEAADAAKNNPDRGRAKGGKVMKKMANGGATPTRPFTPNLPARSASAPAASTIRAPHGGERNIVSAQEAAQKRQKFEQGMAANKAKYGARLSATPSVMGPGGLGGGAKAAQDRAAAVMAQARAGRPTAAKKGGKIKEGEPKKVKKAGGGKCYAKGGSVSSRADGVAKKGKTHTKMVAMKRGGKC